MSENKIRRAFRTTKIKINRETVPSSEQRDALETLFLTMEAAKTDAVSAERTAIIAAARAKTQQAKAQIAEVEFLQTASGNFTQVAGERLWIVYRDPEGTITLEGFTERLLRNNLRAQQDMLGNQIANSGDDNEVDRSGLYEAEDENQGPDPDAN
jgi:hypothetical protein